MLYDAKTETILYDRFLWKDPIGTKEADITMTETETYIEENLKDRVDHISLGASIEFTLYNIITVSTMGCTKTINYCLLAFFNLLFIVLFIHENARN